MKSLGFDAAIQRIAETEAAIERKLFASKSKDAGVAGITPELLHRTRQKLIQLQAEQQDIEIGPVIFEFRPDGVLRFLSDAIYQLTGYKRNDLSGDRWLPALFPEEETRAQVKDLINRSLSEDFAFAELELCRKNSTRVNLEFFFSVRNDPDRSQKSVIATGIDTSSPKQVQEVMLGCLEELQTALTELQVRNQIQKDMKAEINELWRHLIDREESEKQRLATYLHGEPVQDLYALMFQLNAQAVNITDEHCQALVVMANAAIEKVVHSLRNASHELMPPTLSQFGLGKAIGSHLDRFRTAHPQLNFEIELDSGHGLLPDRVQLSIFRIYQHAMMNIAQHANASTVRVTFKIDDEKTTLVIQDDGQGFEVPERWIDVARNGHLGLISASERAQAIGADLNITSEPGEGTLIEMLVPISRL